jgi:Raf kinase inhibitor-like YbhB/YbcL family protein
MPHGAQNGPANLEAAARERSAKPDDGSAAQGEGYSAGKVDQLTLSSSAFESEGEIPVKFTCEGDGVNPPLTIVGIPEGTKSLALIVEDVDAPGGVFDHWIAWNIQPSFRIDENSVPGIGGKNSTGKTGYHGPCPPSGSHRYYFHVYALDTDLDLETGESKEVVQEGMASHILAEATLMGRYGREN